MKIDNRIWKTGVMAAVITLVAGALVMRSGDWFRGVNSKSGTSGQTVSVSSCGSDLAGASRTPAAFTKILPQIVVGSYGDDMYATVIQVVNTEDSDVTVCGDFHSADGESSTTAFTTLVNGISDSFRASLPLTKIPAYGMLIITGTSSGSGVASWARLTATNNVVINCIFEIRSLTSKVLKSRIGVAPSVDNMRHFVIPGIRNVDAGADVGFAIVNTASTPQTLTGTLRDANGVPIKTTPVTLGAFSQTAMFAHEFFSLSEPAAAITNYSSITFDSTSPSFAAIALAFEGPMQTSFPVTPLQ
jgi:hypothetical protein